MKIRHLLAVLAPTVGSCSGASTEPRTPMLVAVAVHDTVAFTNVRLIPMTSSVVLPGRTVLVAGDRIVAIGATGQQRVPSSATVIEGNGRYLMPGLVDMHVHIVAADLATYVSYGITSVRNMWGTPYLLRSPHVGGAIVPTEDGPAIYSASPGIDANPPSWPYTQLLEDPTRADSMVRALAADGWLFLKVYNRLSAETYDSLAAAAHRHGIRFLGHVPFAVPVETVLARGQASIEHLAGYDRALTGGRLGAIAWAMADTLGAPRLATLTAAAGTWNCPTQAVLSRLVENADAATRERAARNRHAVVRALHVAGARLLAGSDAGIDLTVPGSSLHDELAELVASGLTPYEALRVATHDAAEFLERPSEFGSIQPGMRADLVLLRANPLDDVRNTRSIDGVMVRGRLFVRR